MSFTYLLLFYHAKLFSRNTSTNIIDRLYVITLLFTEYGNYAVYMLRTRSCVILSIAKDLITPGITAK